MSEAASGSPEHQRLLEALARAEAASARIDQLVAESSVAAAAVNRELETAKVASGSVTTLAAEIGPTHIGAKAALQAAKLAATEIPGLLEQAKKAAADSVTATAAVNQQLETAKAAATSASALSGEIAPTNQQAKASLDAAKKAAGEVPPLVEVTRKAAAESAPIHEQIKATRDEALKLLTQIKTDAAKTAEIARIADEKDKRVDTYEKQLGELSSKCDELRGQIVDLLPEATGVGLAKSFNTRKIALGRPIRIYFWIFICSVLGFIGLGMYGIFVAKIDTLEEFFKFLLERAPIVIGLILLEEFSRRQYSSTTKLEEDYAYKETISIAFDGYKKAMESLTPGASESLAVTFSKTVIDTLRERPGRLLERDETPLVSLGSLLEASPSVANAVPGGDPQKLLGTAKQAVNAVWLKGIAIVLAVLLGGAGIGYFFGAKHEATQQSESPVPITSDQPKKK